MYKIFIPFLWLLAFSMQAQDITPKGTFSRDSIKVGMPVQYSLSVTYPRNLDVVFPDSSFNFAPFEFEKKEYFPTKTDSLYSYDSAIYTFVTFEVDSVQYLQLPVYLVSEDSTSFFTSTDSVILQHVVSEIPDTVSVENLPLKENADYLPVALQFNYPYLIIGIIILIIVVLLIIIIFGKRIRKWLRLRKMRKQYEQFLGRYGDVVERETDPMRKASRAVSLWKSYMESLTGYPYTKLTTKEIYAHAGDESLRNALSQLDKLIYGGKPPFDDRLTAYDELFRYTEGQYNKNVEDIRNG